MKLFNATDAVHAIGDALECDVSQQFEALAAANLPRIRHLLDNFYADVDPITGTGFLSGITRFLQDAASTHYAVARHHPDEAAAAIAMALARHHGKDLRLTPITATLTVFDRLRNLQLTPGGFQGWVRARLTEPLEPPPSAGSTLPLDDITIAYSHGVTCSSMVEMQRARSIGARLHSAVSSLGGRVLMPSPRGLGGSGPWRPDSEIALEGLSRLDEADVLAVFGDRISSGSSLEIDDALKLRLHVLVIQANRQVTPRLSDSRIHHVEYGQAGPQAIPRLVVSSLMRNQRLVLQSARRRHDRKTLWASRRVSLLRRWSLMDQSGQERLCASSGLSLDRVNLLLSCSAGMDLGGAGEIEILHVELGVPLPGPREPALAFDYLEYKALGAVAKRRGVPVDIALEVASHTLKELAVQGDRRGRLTDEHRWEALLDAMDRRKAGQTHE